MNINNPIGSENKHADALFQRSGLDSRSPGLDPLSLGPVVLAPDVEHEHAGNEEQGHHQHWHWPHLGTWKNRLKYTKINY
jgi:hypothetical protein